MRFGLKHFKKYCKDNGIILTDCRASRVDVPAAGGGTGFWEFTVYGTEVEFGYTIYYGVETLFNIALKPMPYSVFKLLDEYIDLCDKEKGEFYNYGFTDNKGSYIIGAIIVGGTYKMGERK